MKGRVLTFNPLDGNGLISGDDGVRYPFSRLHLQGGVVSVTPGTEVDFELVLGAASNIFVLPGAMISAGGAIAGGKDKTAAALLAFFLGVLGVHKFYLNKTGAGVVMLLCGTIGWLFFAIPPIVMGIIAFIEFIIYLTKSDAQFHQDYVVGNRSWF